MDESTAEAAVNNSSRKKGVAEAARALDLLHRQADATRAELLALRRDVVQVEHRFSALRGAQLLEANEHLVLASLRTQEIADEAKRRLHAVTRSGRLVAAPVSKSGQLARTENQARIEDLRAANEKLVLAALSSQELEADAQRAYRRQVQFLDTVVHELRNPLMPLKLAAQLLVQARSDEQLLLKLQGTINDQVAHMSRLIGDLLDSSRMRSGKFRLERRSVEIGGVLKMTIEACRAAIDGRRQRFTSVVPPGPLYVNGDSVRLMQIFTNLLDNASKYTPDGGDISLRAVALPGAVSITVADNGIGITAQALPHILELFAQDEHATVFNRSGLGIGLAVVRELVEAHEGTVTAASGGKDLGSQFVVTLPLIAAGPTGSP